MTDITVEKINNVYMRVDCERSIATELHEYFSFFAQNYQFMPSYKNHIWDGRIKLFDLQKGYLYAGLIHYLNEFAKERCYSIKNDKRLILTEEFSLQEAKEFIKSLNVPKHIEERDYQIRTFAKAIRLRRCLMLSPTASGKSFIIYLILRYLSNRTLLIVPTTHLVEQMQGDFKSYGYDVDKHCHMIYSGKDKNTDKLITISTWQSMQNMDPEYFEKFETVLVDEAHLASPTSVSSGKYSNHGSIKKILENCVNAEYRFGTTGTLSESKTHQFVLEGLMGPVIKAVTTKQLMDQKYLSELKIKGIVLHYTDDEKAAFHKNKPKKDSKKIYSYEIDYLVSNPKRNRFISNLSLSLNGNTLVLYNFVDRHGKILYDMIKSKAGSERKVFFIHQKVKAEERNEIRAIVEKETNAIIVASYATFSTGTNIVNLSNIILAHPFKGKIRNLQSIGRGLRRSKTKTVAKLYDVSDKLHDNGNITLNHFMTRLDIYSKEGFNFKLYEVKL